jgi:hypothetical protein
VAPSGRAPNLQRCTSGFGNQSHLARHFRQQQRSGCSPLYHREQAAERGKIIPTSTEFPEARGRLVPFDGRRSLWRFDVAEPTESLIDANKQGAPLDHAFETAAEVDISVVQERGQFGVGVLELDDPLLEARWPPLRLVVAAAVPPSIAASTMPDEARYRFHHPARATHFRWLARRRWLRWRAGRARLPIGVNVGPQAVFAARDRAVAPARA